MKTFLTAAALLLLPALSQAQIAPSPVSPPSISTSGESTVYVTPDEVRLSVGIETVDHSLDKAKADLDGRSQQLLGAIKAGGIESKNVQTDTVQVSIDYENDGRTFAGYRARRSYVVKIPM